MTRRVTAGLWQYGAGTAAPTLVLAPYGGGSAYSLTGWLPHLLTDGQAAIALQYPGHGPRMAEPAPTRLSALAEQVAADLARHTTGPLVLVGHSMGGVLCHEIARLLEAADRRVELLVISAARPPRLNRLDPARVLAMDRADWLAELDLTGFGTAELTSTPQAVDMIIPVLRADYLMLARHTSSGGRVSAPVLAMGGADDPWVEPEHLLAWAELTTGAFRSVLLPGGHFYYRDDLPAFAAHIRSAIAGRVSSTTDGVR